MPEVQAGSDAPEALVIEPGQYEVTLQSLVFPVIGHALFNAVAALAILLVGHPWIAAGAFAIGMGLDLLQQVLVRRWLRTAAGVEESTGMSRLALFCAARMSGAMAPLTWLIVRGGAAEVLVAAITTLSLLAIGQTMGGLSRRIFWGYIGPILASFAVAAVLRLPIGQAAAVLVALANCSMIMWMLSHNTSRVILAWRAEYDAKKQAIAGLQVARDEARRANQAKSSFLATMSHEIRTPMNGVLGMAELLRRDEADPVQKQRLEVLIDSGEYLMSILNDILDVSKVDAGKVDITPAPADVRDFLQRLVGFWGARADEKGVTLTLEVDASVPRVLAFDSVRLRQVLFNLVGNALKFTGEGYVEVSARATPESDGLVRVHLAVRDTGGGIAAEHLPSLFDRFSQADDFEVRRFGGTGLGLAIAKQLVELMGGRIWAESELGRGSTFQIELPLAVAEAAPPALAEASAGPGELGKLRVLAVDDNAVNLLVLDQLLASLGCDVVKAASGAEALAALAVEPFDLVLMDIQMPEMSGVEAVKRLRETDGPNRDAPVIALTADVTSGGRERYLPLGFDEHSSKPIQIVELTAAMARATAARPRSTQAA